MTPKRNGIQLAVLRWIADGGDMENPVAPAFKTSAVALQSHGLVEIDRRGGRWSAKPTDKGTYYLLHGRYS